MKRLLSTASAVLLFAGSVGTAQAQDDVKVPAFELGVYGGGAWSSSWIGVNDDLAGVTGDEDVLEEGFGIGTSPIFGVTASTYFTPMFGLRLHGAYMPSAWPTGDDDMATESFGDYADDVRFVNGLDDDENQSDYPLNNWFADLDLVIRPWIQNEGSMLASTYFFLGGGVLVTDVADYPPAIVEDEISCVNAYQRLGACLPYQADYATVGQGTVGFGFNVLPIAESLGIFGEIAVHAYDSPAHTPDEDSPIFTQTLAEDQFAWTPRAVLGVKMAFGDLTPPPPPPPPPAPEPEPAPEPAPPPPPVEREIRVCVVQGNALTEVAAIFLPETGDTLVAATREPFATTYPATAPDYATGAQWFVGNEPIEVMDQEYVKFGVTRVITPAQLQAVAQYEGVSLFAESGTEAPYQVLYAPVRTGCEFQPYQLREAIRPRG